MPRKLAYIAGPLSAAGVAARDRLVDALEGNGWLHVDATLLAAAPPDRAERRAKERATLFVLVLPRDARCHVGAIEAAEIAARRRPAVFLIERIEGLDSEELHARGFLRLALASEGYVVVETADALAARVAGLRDPSDAAPRGPRGRCAPGPPAFELAARGVAEMGRAERALEGIPPWDRSPRPEVIRMLEALADAIEARAEALADAARAARVGVGIKSADAPPYTER